MRIEIFDTTLRDGAQGPGVSFTLEDKIRIIRALCDFGVDYIEAGNPFSNPKDMELFAAVRGMDTGGTKITAFGSTRRPGTSASCDAMLNGLLETGAPAVCVFGKSSLFHVEEILKTTAEENLSMIEDTVRFLKESGREVIYDAEHFFDGYILNPEYALETIRTAKRAGADVIALCDTNGGMLPSQIENLTKIALDTVGGRVAIHCHNDSGLAIAGSIAAVDAGACQVQGTMLGLGERCGNTNLCAIIPTLRYKMDHQFAYITDEKLKNLYSVTRHFAEIANITMDESMPYVGTSAFKHKAGMHIDAVNKNPRSFEHIPPDTVGNARTTLVSEVAGRAALLNKINEIDPTATKESPQTLSVLESIKNYEHEGYQFENAEGSLALIILGAIGKRRTFFELETFKVVLNEPAKHGKADLAAALIKVSVDGSTEITAAEGYGPVNALDKALRRSLSGFYPNLKDMRLVDYKVRVLNTSDATAAKVRVIIESTDGKSVWRTVGVSTDVIEASWHALIDSVEYILSKQHGLLS